MKLFFPVIALGAMLLPAWPAAAAENALKPGTYRTTTTVTQVPDSPAPITTTEEECLTAKEARDAYASLMRTISVNDEDCIQSNVKTTSGKVSFDMRCKDIGSTFSQSRVEMTFDFDWFKVEMTTQTGRDVIKVKHDAKWVKAGCSKKD